MRPHSEHPWALLSEGRTSWSGSWAMVSLEGSGCALSVGGKTKYGHVGDFSPLTTLVGKQELEQAPDSAPFQQLEELYSGSDPDDVLG